MLQLPHELQAESTGLIGLAVMYAVYALVAYLAGKCIALAYVAVADGCN